MGRRPFGDRAMTGAEKQRRYRERRRVKNSSLGERVRALRVTALEQELAQARKRIVELARLQVEIAVLKAENAALKAGRPRARASRRPPARS